MTNMKTLSHWIFITLILLVGTRSLIGASVSPVIRQMCAEKRFEEAVQKLGTMADGAKTDAEQSTYLQEAIDIVLNQLKDVHRAEALIGEIRDPAWRDFVRLKFLYQLKRYDEVLALVQGKQIDDWPLTCRGAAYKLLGDICEARTNNVAALDYYTKAIEAPRTSLVDQGWSAYAAGLIHLKEGNRTEAEAFFRRGLTISPAYYAWRNTTMITLARMLTEDQKTAEAVQLFETVDFSVPSSYWKATLLDAYAAALLADGRKIKAAETLDMILQLDVSKDWKARIEKRLDEIADAM